MAWPDRTRPFPVFPTILLVAHAAGCSIDSRGQNDAGNDPARDSDADSERSDFPAEGDPVELPYDQPDTPETLLDWWDEDAAPCTASDLCNDHQTCTRDVCAEGPRGLACHHTLMDDYCWIEDNCFPNTVPSPTNDCVQCNVLNSLTSWTPLDNKRDCNDSEGMCCFGLCGPGGECCDGADCAGTGACAGDVTDCAALDTESECRAQGGCTWTRESSGSCTGDNSNRCNSAPPAECSACNGCSLKCNAGESPCGCRGTPTYPCSVLIYPEACRDCGCEWTGNGYCSGRATECVLFYQNIDCNAQAGCLWAPGECLSHQCS